MAVALTRPPFVLHDLSAIQVQAKLFRGLGDPTRLRILRTVLDGERTVSDLVDLVGAPQGRVSSHLACLRWCGFVAVRRAGRQAYYRVADPQVRRLLAVAGEFAEAQHDRIACCTIIDRRGR